MTVIFPKWTNHLPTIAALGAGCGLVVVVFVITYWFSPRHTDVGYAPTQPVPYSHKLHAGLLGMDCRYCHQKVEEGPHATVPPTETCMNCHKQVKTTSELLAPVRQSAATGEAIPWVKVHLLPDFVYFDHSAHLNAGVGCAECHGRIDQFDVVRQVEPLSMSWCLSCHMSDHIPLRPRSELTNMGYVVDQAAADKLRADKKINPPIHCSGCHR